jgi:multidrug resistance efflux pump
MGLVATSAVVLAAIVGVAASGRSHVASGAGPAASTERPVVRAIGYTEPASEVRRLVTAKDGVIARVHHGIGDHVRAGDVLLDLRSETEVAQLEVARAELDLARAQRLHGTAGANAHALDAAQKRLSLLAETEDQERRESERTLRLVDAGTLGGAEAERADSALRRARAAREEAGAELERLRSVVTPQERVELDARVGVALAAVRQAETAVEQLELRAPSDGVVLDVLRREGEAARTLDGQPAVLFADDSAIRVRAEVDERHVGRVRAGDRASVTARSLGGRRIEGQVTALKRIMGKRSVFARTSDERRDLDVLETWISIPAQNDLPFGIEVSVEIDPQTK